jgi:hypothetical protein
MKLILLLLAIIVLAGGCQYANARLRDAADCVAVSATVGRGFVVDAQATWLARVGIGKLKGQRYAVYFGEPRHMPTRCRVLGLGPVSLEVMENGDYGLYWLGLAGLPYALAAEGEKATLRWTTLPPGEGREYYGNYFPDVGFALHLFYGGVEFRVKLLEIIDFLAGFTTIDISSDDIRVSQEPIPSEEAQVTPSP